MQISGCLRLGVGLGDCSDPKRDSWGNGYALILLSWDSCNLLQTIDHYILEMK